LLAVRVGERLGLRREELEELRLGAELHDVGKLAIPDVVLQKPGPLDTTEWGFIHSHTLIGQRILSAAPALRQVGVIVRSTHENWDGTGYPDRLAGEAIPLDARIIAACDAYSAMRSHRPYRGAMASEEQSPSFVAVPADSSTRRSWSCSAHCPRTRAKVRRHSLSAPETARGRIAPAPRGVSLLASA
jgi:response regulator RpfG family c-di-GMP phosphodiesterase